MCIKKIVGSLRAVSGTPHPKNFTSAIIAAAGLSERFGGDVTKQLTTLCGSPLLIHTLRAYEQSDCIHEIILVAKMNEIPAWEVLCREHGITAAILKESSPSCGSTRIYDGTHTGVKIPGRGLAARLLSENGVTLYSEKALPEGIEE